MVGTKKEYYVVGRKFVLIGTRHPCDVHSRRGWPCDVNPHDVNLLEAFVLGE